MRQVTLICGLILALVAIAMPASAAAPFGSFGGIVGGGNAATGVVPLHGWALDDNGIQRVDIYVDGVPVGRARYGRQRTAVAAQFPGYPDSEAAGFAFQLDTTRFHNGVHEVRPLAISKTGEKTFLRARSFQFTNVTHQLVPFGKIEFPNRNAQLFGTCDLENAHRRYSVFTGYALDAGVETGDEGMGYLELLVDGAILANTRTGCFFAPETGGLSDCYGLIRQDIESRFPGLKDSPSAGYRFVLDLGLLLNLGFVPGFHVITIRGGDISGQVANIDEIPVTFLCDEFAGNEGAIGYIGQPINGLTYKDYLNVSGWAIDWETVDTVEIWVDGEEVGEALYGFGRPGVPTYYPSYPFAANAGFNFQLDTTTLSDGRHQLQVFINDREGGRTLIGERDFVVNNLVAP